MDLAPGQSVTTTLSWADGGGATSYDVFFGTSNPPASQGNQPGTTFNPGTLNASTTYYWRIDARNSAGVTPGAVWSFTTGAQSCTYSLSSMSANVGTLSGSGSFNVTTESSCRWLANSDDEDWLYTGSGQTGNGTVNYIYLANTGANSRSAHITVQGQTFTLTQNGVSCTTLATPAATGPTCGTTVANTAPTLTWTDVANESFYTLTIYTNSSCSGSPIITLVKLPANTTSYSLAGFLEGGKTYSWQVQANGNHTTYCDSSLSSCCWFRTPDSPPQPPNWYSPATGVINQSVTTTLSWGGAAGATSYDVYFGTSNPPASQGTQSGTTFNPGTLSASTTYYWRINAKNSAGTTQGTVWSFTTGSTSLTMAAISVQPYPSEGGSVSGGGTYTVGSSQEITATANSGWSFTGWNDGITQNPRTITVPAGGASYTANFQQQQQAMATITVLADPAEGGSVTGSGTYPVDSSQQITATANPGWYFNGWEDSLNYENPLTITVPAGGATYTAIFLHRIPLKNPRLTYTESTKDSLVCTKDPATSEYSCNPTSKGTLKFAFSADILTGNDFNFANFKANTPISITTGILSGFSATFIDGTFGDSQNYTDGKGSLTFLITHYADDDSLKVDGKLIVTMARRRLTISLSLSNCDNWDFFRTAYYEGNSYEGNSSGPIKDSTTLELDIGDWSTTYNLNVTGRVSTKTVTGKDKEPYDLNTSSVLYKLAP